jgi:hypothetical protein
MAAAAAPASNAAFGRLSVETPIRQAQVDDDLAGNPACGRVVHCPCDIAASVEIQPASWKEMFMPELHHLAGS